VNHPIDRRTFLERCTLAGAGVLASSIVPEMLLGNSMAEMTVCAVAGDRFFENTMMAVDALGGMKKFVRMGASVALLTNSVFDRVGTYVNPDIALSVAKMCLDAGAGSVIAIEDTPASYWNRSSFSGKLSREISLIGRSGGRRDVQIGRGKALKEGSAASELLSADVFINIPIIKDHRGTHYTGNLKNMMGAFSSSTCRRCHLGDRSVLTGLFQGFYSKPELLAQSIADLSLVRTPDLSIADVTEILSTNGPSGPGKLKTPMQVVAGTNGVAVDMYCVRHLGLNPEELLVIQRAQDHGLGPKNLKEVTILTK
jgi:uncharacterized protein (DUF362 family)